MATMTAEQRMTTKKIPLDTYRKVVQRLQEIAARKKDPDHGDGYAYALGKSCGDAKIALIQLGESWPGDDTETKL